MKPLTSQIQTADQRDSRGRSELLERIRRRFEIQWRQWQIGELCIELAGVRNPDDVFEQAEAGFERREDPASQPYWAQWWESALAAAGVLSNMDLAGTTVLDLGCGLGLPGTIAAARGARVLMADAVGAALLFAKLNSWPWRRCARVRRVDWRQDSLNERFDIVVGADILYDRADWPYLEIFLAAHVTSKGSVLLGEPGRSSGDEFLDWAASRGWTLRCAQSEVQGREKPVRLIRALPPEPTGADHKTAAGMAVS